MKVSWIKLVGLNERFNLPKTGIFCWTVEWVTFLDDILCTFAARNKIISENQIVEIDAILAQRILEVESFCGSNHLLKQPFMKWPYAMDVLQSNILAISDWNSDNFENDRSKL